MKKLTVVALFLLFAGCTTDQVCEPGLQIECGCPNDVTGYQTCLEDGSGWGDCDCPCVKDCTGRECGPDPVCGQPCGTCGANSTCSQTGQCECDFEDCQGACCASGQVCAEGTCCTPVCGQRECGSDPVCGADCGNCGTGEQCTVNGTCLSGCTPDCTGRVCGPDPVCSLSCGECQPGSLCTTEGQCVSGCTPNCAGRECGPDPVCNTICGYCAEGEACSVAGQCFSCTPDCTNQDCGDDGCGGSCGDCDNLEVCSGSGRCECAFTDCSGTCCGELEVCYPAGTCCAPDCVDKECGDDGCGGECGTCDALESCNNAGSCYCTFSQCQGTCCTEGQTCYPADACCTPDCANKECGDDGCGGECGTCETNEICGIDGLCACDTLVCGEECCASGQVCFPADNCCTIDCADKECGDDGCGDLCGTCDTFYNCVEGTCEVDEPGDECPNGNSDCPSEWPVCLTGSNSSYCTKACPNGLSDCIGDPNCCFDWGGGPYCWDWTNCPGSGQVGNPCPFSGEINMDADTCAFGLSCLGIPATGGSGTCPGGDDLECTGVNPAWNPDCVNGNCGASFCSEPCDAGNCPAGFHPQDVGSLGCMCIPDMPSDCTDPVNNVGCSPGQTCTPVGGSSLVCLDTGPNEMLNPCDSDDRCVEGHACVTLGTTGRCYKFCDKDAGTGCPAQGDWACVGWVDVDRWGFCVPNDSCTMGETQCSDIDDGLACIIATPECDEYRCYFSQNLGQGEVCQYTNSCADGMFCTGSPGVCVAICNDDGDCPGACLDNPDCSGTWGMCD